MKTLKRLKMAILMYKRYVDDANLGLKGVPKGLVWVGDRLIQGPADQDLRTSEVRTSQIVRQIANTIMPSLIKMEEDIPSNKI